MFNLSQLGHSQSHENELVKALEEVLSNDSFKVKAPSTIEARRCAEELLRWCLKNENSGALNKFTIKLTESLQTVLRAASTKLFTTNHDKYGKDSFFYGPIQSL